MMGISALFGVAEASHRQKSHEKTRGVERSGLDQVAIRRLGKMPT
jgi:hypothetical protein